MKLDDNSTSVIISVIKCGFWLGVVAILFDYHPFRRKS